MRFGHLFVIGFESVSRDEGSRKARSFWRCRCDCGNETVVLADNLKRGNTKSCGCLKRSRAPKVLPSQATHCDGRRKYACDGSFFDTVDDERKAYWLGFLTADGGVNGNKIQVNLSARDEMHLHKLNGHLRSSYPVTRGSTVANGKSYERASLTMSNESIVRGLASHGVTEQKSLSVSPATIRPSLARHYWRGFVDGNASVSVSPGGVIVSLTGTREMLEGFMSFASTVCSSEAKPVPSRSVWQVQVKDRKGTLLARVLYQDATVFLDRKMETLRPILEPT